jgi:RNA polymerase sigma-70 factor (ECF subfamily)
MKHDEPPMGTDAAAPAPSRTRDPADEPTEGDSSPLAAVDPNDRDAQLVTAIAAGRHREALRLCARQHGTTIGRLCMAMTGSQAEAEDLTQETLLAAHDGFSSFRAEGSPRAWLCAIARRKCARHLERHARQESQLRLVRESKLARDTDEAVMLRERAAAARAALGEVRPSEREALVLRYVSELSYRELGEAFDIDEAAARKRVSRAIARLRAVLASKE